MAASLFIEEESGTCTGRSRHPHNGYYAGDFSQTTWSGSELHPSPAAPVPSVRSGRPLPDS